MSQENQCPNSGNCTHKCKFDDVTNPFECSTVHRDVKELREDYKTMVKQLADLDKKMAIGAVKTAIFTALVSTVFTSLFVGIMLRLMLPGG